MSFGPAGQLEKEGGTGGLELESGLGVLVLESAYGLSGSFAQMAFGSFGQQYVFPLSFQVKDRVSSLQMLNSKTPFTMGSFNPSNISLKERTITVYGDMGCLVQGQNNYQLLTAADLEAERCLLAGLQALGRQPLTCQGKFCNAYLQEFNDSYGENLGYRVSTWTLKFVADDPRYYLFTPNSFTNAAPYNAVFSHKGNVRAYPTITFTGIFSNPNVALITGGKIVYLGLSLLATANAGDKVIFNCDPRPENAQAAVQYIPAGGAAQNGLVYCSVAAGDMQNTYDYSAFLPFIEPTSVVPSGSQLLNCAIGSGSASVTVTYYDTFI